MDHFSGPIALYVERYNSLFQSKPETVSCSAEANYNVHETLAQMCDAQHDWSWKTEGARYSPSSCIIRNVWNVERIFYSS